MIISFDLLSMDSAPASILKVHLRKFVFRLAEMQPGHSFIIYDAIGGNQGVPGNVTLQGKVPATPGGWLARMMNRKPIAAGLHLALFDSRKKIKKGSCLMIGDLSPLIHPGQFDGKATSRFKTQLKKAMAVSEILIVFTACYDQFLVKELNVPADKIQHWDISNPSSPSILNYEAQEQVRARHTDDKAYFLYAGDLHQRHELLLLLKAFSDFKKWQRSGMLLVIAGYENGWSEVLKNLLATYKYRQDVLLILNPEDALVQQLTASAYCVVHPAAHDPFPVTIHSTMQLKIPVIASDIPEIRSVAGDGIIYAAMNVTSLSQAMQRIYKDEEWRSETIAKATAVIQRQPSGGEQDGELLIQRLINSWGQA